MRRELSGRTALVTGGNVGIGRAIAIALAESGADVAVTYMTHAESDVVSSIEALGRKSMSLQVDVTDSGQVGRAMEAIASAFGHIDILVNNAGGQRRRAGTPLRGAQRSPAERRRRRRGRARR